MPRGNWLKQPKARLGAGLIIGLLVCAVWIGYGLLESANYERQARANANQYARDTGDKVAEACVRIPSLERVKCLQEAEDAQREYKHNQDDLVAQRQSALWAYIMASAAIIGMVLSAVGVWLVKATFEETKVANTIAKDAQRAWLSIEDIKIESLWSIYVKGVGFSIGIVGSYEIKNSGSAPALDVDWLEFGWDGQTAQNDPEVGDFITTHIKGNSEGRTCVAPGATRKCEFSFAVNVPAPRDHAFVFMLCGVRYRSGDIGGDQRYTIQGYEVFRRQQNGNPTPSTIQLDEIKWTGTLQNTPFTPLIRPTGRFEMT